MSRDQPEYPFAEILKGFLQEPGQSPPRARLTADDEIAAVRRLCRQFILGECEGGQLTIIFQQAIALYESEEESFRDLISDGRLISCEETERAIQVLVRIKVIFKAVERRFCLGRLSQDDRQAEEVRVWGLLQGVESLLGVYLLQRAAWTIWGPSADRVGAMLGHGVEFNTVPWDADDEGEFRSLFSHAYQHVVESIGSERCLYDVVLSAGLGDAFGGAGRPIPVQTILLLPYRVFDRTRAEQARTLSEDPSIDPNELQDDEDVKSTLQYLQGDEQTEEEFRNRLFRLRTIALYAFVDAHACVSAGASVEELRTVVVEPFCRVSGYPNENAAAVLAMWRVDCLDHEYKRGLDNELLSPWMEQGQNPRLYRKMLWSLARQGHWHKVCHLLESSPPPDFDVWDVVLRVGVLLATGQWQRAFFEQRHQFPRGGADGGVHGAVRHHSLALWTLVDGMLHRGQFHDLLSLPFSKEEEQDVISYLHDSQDGHVLLLLLLRRRLIERAVAVHELVRHEFPANEVMTKDLARILRNYEPLLPEEEVRALKGFDSSQEDTEKTRWLVASLTRTARAFAAAEQQQNVATPQASRAPRPPSASPSVKEATGQRRQSWSSATPPPPPFSAAPTPFTPASRDAGGPGLGMSRADRAKTRAEMLRRSSPGLRAGGRPARFEG